ncbi:Mitogen-activated protein kinase kinase 8 [Zea mays]|uniref:Mitogen-activated protein kinase kinase 8 n=1 Tax=Zea mays TaxID=4577 RepID=A0A317Y7A5_MAIZE|nr:Mitogen-activated protein kinase kinase 8 [Zea mays]
MALTVRERRLPQLHISLDVPSCAFRHPNPPAAASASAPRASGEFRLSEFDRLAVLGRGNGGTVYKVAHRRTSALYALKVLHRGDPAAEVDALRRAGSSPHVVRCHSVLLAPAAAPGDVALCWSSWTAAARWTPSRPGAGRSLRPRSPRSPRRRCPAWRTSTAAASSTATSSRRTSSSAPPGTSRSPTSASPGSSPRAGDRCDAVAYEGPPRT